MLRIPYYITMPMSFPMRHRCHSALLCFFSCFREDTFGNDSSRTGLRRRGISPASDDLPGFGALVGVISQRFPFAEFPKPPVKMLRYHTFMLTRNHYNYHLSTCTRLVFPNLCIATQKGAVGLSLMGLRVVQNQIQKCQPQCHKP